MYQSANHLMQWGYVSPQKAGVLFGLIFTAFASLPVVERLVHKNRT